MRRWAAATRCCFPRWRVPAARLGAATVKIGGVEEPVRNITLRLTQLFNITGHPAITIPCGRTTEGLPIGAQLVGPQRNRTDSLALRLPQLGPSAAALALRRAQYVGHRCSRGSSTPGNIGSQFATKDRVVRPFDWGTDWISTPGRRPTRPDRSRRALGRRVMRDTAAFYHVPPNAGLRLLDGGPRPLEREKPGTLTFPSALTTPHPENNIVSARWFPAADETSLTRRANRGRAVVVLPQWNSDAGGHIGLSRVLARFGVSALRLSLPYHDVRMPPELTRADYIVSSNIVRTVQVCRQAVLDARRAVAWLASLGFERIGILGTSLGSCLAMLTSAHEPRIRAQALNHVSPWFADVVWRGLSTRHVRGGSTGTSTWTGCDVCGGRSAPGRISTRCGRRRRCLCMRRTT